ncbi:hypothetical protein M885DRAFT_608547, partial [Pelagophyceae sp. CCMP2097]
SSSASAARLPSPHRKTLKQLGAPIARFDDLRATGDVAQADFKRASEAGRLRRGTTGRAQPAAPPPVDGTLVGTRIEYAVKITFADDSTALYWIAGVVHEVSDGETPRTSRSLTARSLACARVEFDPQPALGEDEDETSEKWVALHANKFNGEAKGCWRVDLQMRCRGCSAAASTSRCCAAGRAAAAHGSCGRAAVGRPAVRGPAACRRGPARP